MTLVLLHLKNYFIDNLVGIGGRRGGNRPLEVLSDDLTWPSIALLSLIIEYRLHHPHILPIICQGHNRWLIGHASTPVENWLNGWLTGISLSWSCDCNGGLWVILTFSLHRGFHSPRAHHGFDVVSVEFNFPRLYRARVLLCWLFHVSNSPGGLGWFQIDSEALHLGFLWSYLDLLFLKGTEGLFGSHPEISARIMLGGWLAPLGGACLESGS